MRTGIVIFSILLLVLSSCGLKPTTNNVVIDKRQIKVNQNAYLIKGICYHPVPKGSTQRSFENIDQDLALMQEAGINTIRLYSPIDDVSILDKIEKAGIKIIMGFGYNQNGNFDILSGSFINYIEKYKNHNAILFWELGNEYNYHPEWFEGDINIWYKALNNAAALIHKTDTKPVATAHGELPSKEILEMLPNIDIWGLNVYRWDNPDAIYNQWEALSNKPMYLSEAGADSYMTIEKNEYKKGSNEKAQADATANILTSIFNNTEVGLGVTLFSFVDGWWKAGNPNEQDPGGWAPNSSGVPYDGSPNEEYWGILTIDRNKKMAFDVVKKHYNNLNSKN